MMNASNAVQALLNFSHKAAPQKAANLPSLEAQGPAFREQMQAATQAVQRRDASSRQEPQAKPEQNAVQERRMNTVGQALPSDGDSLPFHDEIQALLSHFSEEQQEAILEGLQSWLNGLSEQELAELQAQLEQGQDWSHLLDTDFLLAAVPGLHAQLIERMQQLKEAQQAQMTDQKRSLNQALAGTKENQSELSAISIRSEPFNLSKPFNLGQGLDQLVSSLNQQATYAGGASKVEGLQQLLQSAGVGLALTQSPISTAMQGRVGMASVSLAAQQAAAMANAEALANRISLMQSKNLQAAEMRLDPPGLGSIKISIRMQGENASVFFQSANAHARELIEQALPRLREMMEQGGLALTDAQVSQEDLAQRQATPWNTTPASESAQEENETEAFAGQEITLLQQPLGLIDYYA